MEKKNTVLIIDDEMSARAIIRGYLHKEGYTLLLAENGQQGLAYIETHEVDAIVSDIMMPNMDGFEVCQRLRDNPRGQHIPIILVTALDTSEHLVRGLDVGASDFLTKPVRGVELRARVRSMLRIKNQYDELQSMLALREGLANMVVHDMKNILAIMTLRVGLMEMTATDPSLLDDIEVIRKQTNRLQSFINDLLLAAKMQSNKLVMNYTEVDLQQLIQGVVVNHHPIAESAKITLVSELPTSASKLLQIDVNLFERMVDNLLSNAIKYSGKNSTVTVRLTYPEDATVRLQIIDEGFGIPEEDRERIFDQFEIVSLKAKGVAQTGLGLAFCKMVVEAHGGQISVTANTPQGSIFTVQI